MLIHKLWKEIKTMTSNRKQLAQHAKNFSHTNHLDLSV